MTAKMYSVSIARKIPINTTLGGVVQTVNSTCSDYDYYTIITDTFQDAVSIARANLKPSEVLNSVTYSGDNVIVDPSCIKGQA